MSAACYEDRSPSAWRIKRRRSGGGRASVAASGSGIGRLMSTCLSFETCEEFNKSLTVIIDRRRRASNYRKVMVIAVQPAKQAEEKRRTNTKQRKVVVMGMGVVSLL